MPARIGRVAQRQYFDGFGGFWDGEPEVGGEMAGHEHRVAGAQFECNLNLLPQFG